MLALQSENQEPQEHETILLLQRKGKFVLLSEFLGKVIILGLICIWKDFNYSDSHFYYLYYLISQYILYSH